MENSDGHPGGCRRLIHDPIVLRQFVQRVLDPNEVYVIRYMSRKKWHRAREYMESVIVPGDPHAVLQAVRSFERNPDFYPQSYPEDAFAVYIQFNPRDTSRALLDYSHSIINLVAREELNPFYVQAQWKKHLVRTRKRVDYWMIDVDDPAMLPQVEELKLPVTWTSRTRQGFHVLVYMQENVNKTNADKFRAINALTKVSIHKDDFTVLPGTFQAGHAVLEKQEVE